MIDELKEALLRLKSRPTEDTIRQAETLALKAARNPASVEEVSVAATIVARINLGDGSYSGVCKNALACAVACVISDWLQRSDRVCIPEEFYRGLFSLTRGWESTSSECPLNCTLNKRGREKIRGERSEESEQILAAASMQHQREEVAMHGAEWASTIRQN